MYGPCDPEWRSWLHMPEWALRPYVIMRPRIEAERVQQLIALLLFANGRTMPDARRGEYSQQLDDAASGKSAKPARPSIEQLQSIGMSIRVEGPDGKPLKRDARKEVTAT